MSSRYVINHQSQLPVGEYQSWVLVRSYTHVGHRLVGHSPLLYHSSYHHHRVQSIEAQLFRQVDGNRMQQSQQQSLITWKAPRWLVLEVKVHMTQTRDTRLDHSSYILTHLHDIPCYQMSHLTHITVRQLSIRDTLASRPMTTRSLEQPLLTPLTLCEVADL